jgi:hypothetical protein
MTHSTLLILGGAVLTCVLGFLLFGSKGSAEEERKRQEQKLLRALEAQRRAHERQRAREATRRGVVIEAQRPVQIEQPPDAGEVADAQAAVLSGDEDPAVALKETEAERRAADRQRKRHDKERAAALKTQRGAEEQARRRAEKGQAAALKAEHRAAEQQRKREEKEQAAALKTQRDAQQHERQLAEKDAKAEQAERLAHEHRRREAEKKERAAALAAQEAEQRASAEPEPEPEKSADEDRPDKPLRELPLYSWATRIENEDRETGG